MSSRVVVLLVVGAALVVAAGCAYTPNYYRETGPSVAAPWDSPTASDVKARYASAPLRHREWAPTCVAPENGAVVHWPLYFEDPFVTKGDGRTDETNPRDVYRMGWEDWVALPYGHARFTTNWLLLPVSAIVTPPWTAMESDGFVSKQLLGYDHDATPLGHETASAQELAIEHPAVKAPATEAPRDPAPAKEPAAG